MHTARHASVALLTAVALVLGSATTAGTTVAHATGIETGSVSGRLVGLAGTPFTGSPTNSLFLDGRYLALRALPVSGAPTVSTSVRGDGSFLFEDLPVGDYRLLFEYGSQGPWVSTYVGGAMTAEAAEIVAVSVGETTVIEQELLKEGSFSVTIRGPAGEILQRFDYYDYVYQPPAGEGAGAAALPTIRYNGTTGVLTYSRLRPGEYRFAGIPSSGFHTVYWPSVATLAESSSIVVGSGQAISDLHMVVPYTPKVSGTVVIQKPTGHIPGAGVSVRLVNADGITARSTTADGNGQFVLTDIEPGTYTLCVPHTQVLPQPFAYACVGSSDDAPLGVPFDVAWGEHVTDLEVKPAATARIYGQLSVSHLVLSGYFDASGGSVVFWKLEPEDGEWNAVAVAPFTTGGRFTSPVLQPGEYRVEFRPSGNIDGLIVVSRGYWPEEHLFEDAVSVHVAEGEPVVLEPAQLESGRIDTYRVAGEDRYSTAVKISEWLRSERVERTPAVYIVNGSGYADALSAGPAAAAAGGVMLLVQRDSIPPAVAQELRELQPERIVVVGGTGVIAASTERALQQYVDEPEDVDRIEGEDRYATSRMLVLDTFASQSPLPALFLATGRNFPDALAAGPAASHLGGAVLMLDGSLATIDTETRSVLASLDPDHIYLAGMTGSISGAIESGLRALPGRPQVTRLGGTDRYATAREISKVFGDDHAWTVLATGTGFADALAGGPFAAAYGAPLLLSQPHCIPFDTFTRMLRSGTNVIALVGGTGVLSDDVRAGTVC
ncbi:cell wall-binding repeat-containing protein [Microcella sp.]|uniref:cell wall-binding repeat-containing protein n=1 Tax=Microcella sp. TaxID=1913979 RepID=UPI002561F126|nr:cell wall-binding repeat-containing protein [Microcella sp.]MBX9472754.1 cell wall-binding repeat-containing protein [Microcella sp.]